MTDALLDAENLASVIVDGLGGSLSIDAALAGYGQRRDRRAAPMHGLTSDLARLVPPPEEALAGMAAVAADPAAASRFLDVMAGSAPVARCSVRLRKQISHRQPDQLNWAAPRKVGKGVA